MKRLRSKLTYANVVATLALFLVIAGGSAIAAGQLGKNTVGPKQLKKGAVTAAKIKNGAVTGSKLNTGTIGTVPRAQTAQNAATAQNATSAQNAATVGGQSPAQIVAASKVKCPGDMALAAGVCIETTARPAADFQTALGTCAKAGRAIPSMGQLTAYEMQTYTQYPPYEWVGQMFWDGSKFRGLAIQAVKSASAPSVSVFESSTPTAYRCSQDPLN